MAKYLMESSNVDNQKSSIKLLELHDIQYYTFVITALRIAHNPTMSITEPKLWGKLP